MSHSGQCTVAVRVEEAEAEETFHFKWSKLWKFAGPGLLMSVAFVDPGNLESDLQTGANTGYALLWLLLVTTILGFVVQCQAAKLGVATGKHLAELCRMEYPPVPRVLLWVMAEVAIIGSDIQEVIGSAIALSLLSRGAIPLWGGVLLSALCSFLLLLVERLGVRNLEALFAVMISTMIGSFGVMFVRAEVPAADIARGFLVPSLPRRDVPTAVALMGSLIMPHNIYLHSALVQTRSLLMPLVSTKREALRYFGIESALSLAGALLINLFVVAVFAAGFYTPPGGGGDSGGGSSDSSAIQIGLENAGEFLGSVYGPAMVYIWGLGLLAAGQSSTMTGTYTGQFVMSGYLDLKVSPWTRIFITRCVALLPTLTVALACDTTRGGTQLDVLNQGLNLLQSLQLPFALIPVLTFTSSARIMGEAFVNPPALTALMWAIAAMVIGINATAVYEVATQWTVDLAPDVRGPLLAGMAVLLVGYLALVIYLIVGGPARCCAGGGSGSKRRAKATKAASGADGGSDGESEGEGAGEGEEAPLLPPPQEQRQNGGGCCGHHKHDQQQKQQRQDAAGAPEGDGGVAEQWLLSHTLGTGSAGCSSHEHGGNGSSGAVADVAQPLLANDHLNRSG